MPDKISMEVITDEGTRMVTLLVGGTPDLTPEETCLKHTIRPEQVTLEYISEGLKGWELRKVMVTGRLVNITTGEVSRTTIRRHHAMWTDLAGTGGIHKGKTPKWVVDLAKKFPAPDALPHKR